jgi:plasmid stabilization system protein ParE
MTQPAVVVSRAARADLRKIEEYIESHSGERRAELVIARIFATIRILSLNPGIGTPRSYTKKGELAFPVQSWMIIFEPLSDLAGIHVLRVVDARRDLANLL